MVCTSAHAPQVLEYNVIGGKYQRGLTVLVTLQALVEPKELDADSLQRALTVGWCVELVRAVGKGPEESFPGGVPWVGTGGRGGGGPETRFWVICVSVPLVCCGRIYSELPTG